MSNRDLNLQAPDSAMDSKSVLSFMGKLYVAVFFVVVLEGALRKWVSADLTIPLVLLRDGLSTYGIFWAMRNGKLPINETATQALWLWTACCAVWGLLQVLVNQSSILIYIVGLRFWLLYLWFAYAAAVSLSEIDLVIFIKILLKFILYLTPLIVFQFYSDPGHFINRQVDGDEEKVFRLTADLVRTTGTFSFTAGQTTLLALAGPFVFSALTSSRILLFKRNWMSPLIFIAFASAVMLSGSRAALTTFIFQLIIYMMTEVFLSKSKSKFKIVAILIFGLLVMVILPYIFSVAVDATRERVLDAGDTEDLSERIQSIFFGDVSYSYFSLIGYGIGAGTNFIGVLSNTDFILGETETSRTIMEGGAIGVGFILIKIAVIAIGLKKSLEIARLKGNTLPLMLWLTIALALFTWSIIGQLTVNALGYMLLGLGITANRDSQNYGGRK